VGRLRWRAPQPPARWHGARPATRLPPSCPQPDSGDGARSEAEGCLYLSVYRPRGARRLPVLVWIHGGGLTGGSSRLYDGALIARTDRVVVVTVNYRLGALGFLALDGLRGNYGLLDQRAALRWTARNIARFGGDPANVTVAGESAGGYSVCAALAAPSDRGLFRRAIIQSGGCPGQTLAAGRRGGARFARALGCRDVACLRRKPAGELIDAGPQPPATPTVDGDLLPLAPARGRFAPVPVLIGSTHDEARTFTQELATDTRQAYEGFVRLRYGARARAVLRHYPWRAYPRPYTAAYAVAAILTDSGAISGIGGCATRRLTRRLAARAPTFAYQFDDRAAPALNDQVPGYRWGAPHAGELAYFWPSFGAGLYRRLTPAQRRLSDQMIRYWGAFARAGAPRVPGQPAWPEYSSGRLLSLRPGGATRAITDAQYAAEHQCAFWDGS
jgi:para-nitrobenzyl esterase